MQPASPEVVAGVLRIPIYDLVHGENARGELGDVSELANSLKTIGQQQPLLVQPREDGKWSVWDGNRRLKAARLAGVEHMMVIPRKTVLTDRDRILRQLGMHSAAKAFDPIAEAKAIHVLMFGDGEKMSREEIARALSKSPGWVKGRIDLLQLAPDEQVSVSQGRTTVGAALAAVGSRRNPHNNGFGRPGGNVAARTVRARRCASFPNCGCICHQSGGG